MRMATIRGWRQTNLRAAGKKPDKRCREAMRSMVANLLLPICPCAIILFWRTSTPPTPEGERKFAFLFLPQTVN
jgi:hypothetical protein